MAEYIINGIRIIHQEGFFSVDPTQYRKEDKQVQAGDARRAHEDWRYNILNRKESANITDTNSFGDTVELSRLAVNMAIREQNRGRS